MAGGFAKDGAVQDQIDANVEDAVNRARSKLPRGESLRRCQECDADIPEARRKAIPGVRLCVSCQEVLDRVDLVPGHTADRLAGRESFPLGG